MKLVTFVEGGSTRPGLVVEGGIVDLGAEGFKDTIAFIGAAESVQAELAKKKPSVSLKDAKLLAPVPAPPRIFGIGINYAEHPNRAIEEFDNHILEIAFFHNLCIVRKGDNTEPSNAPHFVAAEVTNEIAI